MYWRPDWSLTTHPISTYFTGLPELLRTLICGARASLPASCAQPSNGATGESGNCRNANLAVRSAETAADVTARPLRLTVTTNCDCENSDWRTMLSRISR